MWKMNAIYKISITDYGSVQIWGMKKIIFKSRKDNDHEIRKRKKISAAKKLRWLSLKTAKSRIYSKVHLSRSYFGGKMLIMKFSVS